MWLFSFIHRYMFGKILQHWGNVESWEIWLKWYHQWIILRTHSGGFVLFYLLKNNKFFQRTKSPKTLVQHHAWFMATWHPCITNMPCASSMLLWGFFRVLEHYSWLTQSAWHVAHHTPETWLLCWLIICYPFNNLYNICAHVIVRPATRVIISLFSAHHAARSWACWASR